MYTGKVDSLTVLGGYEKARFTWQINADPRINRVVIYWDNRRSQTEVSVNRTSSDVMEMEAIVEVAESPSVDFELFTMDTDGNFSMSVFKAARVYGPKYISEQFNRKTGLQLRENNELTIGWRFVESSAIQYTTVRYTDFSDPSNPIQKSIRVENDEYQTILEGVRADDQLSIVSSFLPDDSFEIMDALPDEYTVAAIFLELSSTENVVFNGAGQLISGEEAYTFSTNYPTWNVVSDQPWLIVNREGMNFTVSVAPNFGTARTATITVIAGPVSVELHVSQQAIKLLDKSKFIEMQLPGDNIWNSAGRPLSLMWDNNVNTIWHSDNPIGLPFPQYVSVDLGVEAVVNYFKLWSRAGFYYSERSWKTFEIWGASSYNPGMTEEYWTGDAWKNDGWEMLADCEIKRPSGNPDPIGSPTGEDLELAVAGFDFQTTGDNPVRYIRFIIKSTWASPADPLMYMSEMNVYTLEE